MASATTGFIPVEQSIAATKESSTQLFRDRWACPSGALIGRLRLIGMVQPLYTFANCRVAYQLHWSLTTFATRSLPPQSTWLDSLRTAIEPDGLHLLEVHDSEPATIQFFISTQPQVAPAEIVRSVKGRLQYLLRNSIPQLWRRHYSLTSVGTANNDVLQNYVAKQVQHHPMADARIVERLSRFQFHDSAIELTAVRSSAHGRYITNLHLVFETLDHLCDVREEWLRDTHSMLIAACRKKIWQLSRFAIVANHLHVLLGCKLAESPQVVAMSLLNNLAFAHGMRRVFEPSYYAGTFGSYDEQAIRRKLAADQ